MNERLVPLTLCTAKQVAGTVLRTVVMPFGATLVGMSAALDAVSGTPTGATVDVNVGGSALTGFTGVSIGTTAGTGATVKTSHFGGTVAPVAIAADAEVDIDVNLTAGSSPEAAVTVVLWLLV